MSGFLQKLKQKEGKLVMLNYFLSYDISVPRQFLGRISDVGIDYFILDTFENGNKKEILFPYPTPGLGFITLSCSDFDLDFQREALEYLSKKET